MVVVDASVILELLLSTPSSIEIQKRLFSQRETLHAPHLLDLEVVQVLRRYVGSRDMSSDRAREALSDFLDIPIRRYPHDLFLDRIWELRSNMTAYDAAYVVLAELLETPLITRDKKLAGAAGHRAQIELI
ncbi:type II toxin-antitoxin system VapC family toxin [bacterium]|nr:type II toxin-antitoxin system VapC family toxin [bacterium]